MSKFKNLFFFLSCFSVIMFSACKDDDVEPDAENNPSVVMHNSNGTVSFSYLKQVPPGEVSDSKILYSFAAPWAFRALSISPGGKYGAIAMFSQQGTARQWEGKIRLYNTVDGGFFKEYNKADLIALMNFSIPDASMVVEKLDWISNDELLIHLQPQTPWVESVPQNASLVINVLTDTKVDLKYSGRSAPFNIQAPDHASRTLYPSEVRQNKLYIEGNLVRNLPDLTSYQIYFNEG